jgi:hypothetical protein
MPSMLERRKTVMHPKSVANEDFLELADGKPVEAEDLGRCKANLIGNLLGVIDIIKNT